MIQVASSGTPLELAGRRRRGISVTSSGTAFSPASVAGLHAWFKPETLGADTTAIASWTDSSGGGRNATQATGANQPVVTANALNGLKVATFDGVNDILAASITANAARTLFVVAKQAANTNVARAVSFGSNLAGLANAGGNFAWGTNEATSFVDFGVSATAAYQILCVRFNTTASADWFVGTGAGTNFDPSDSYSTSTTLDLSTGDGVSNFWNGTLAEVVLYNAAVSESDRTSVRDYLKAKFAL